MKKLFFLTLLLLFFCTKGWCATRTWEGDDLTNPTYWNDADNWGGTVPVAGDDVVINNNKDCFVNANTAALKSLDMTGYTGTLSGTFSITVRGLTASTNVCKIAGTITWTGTLIFSPVSTTAVIQLTSNSNLLTTMTVTSGAAVSLVVLQDNLSFTAVKTNSITLTTQGLDLNGKTISGNSSINRLLIRSVTLGTPASLTTSIAGSTFAYCDFRDITFINGANLDLSGITGKSGDCGGNTCSGYTLTLTTTDDWYFYDDGAGTFNFSDYTQWYEVSGGTTQMASTRCVLPQDNAYFDSLSINGVVTVDQDMPRVCKTLDFTGVDAMNFHMNNVSQTIYGGLTVVSNVTLSSSISYSFTFEGRDEFILTTNAVSLGNTSWIVAMVGGSLTLADNLTITNGISSNLFLNNGTFDADVYNVTVGRFFATNNATRTLNMGSGLWTTTSTVNSETFNISNTGTLTFDKGTANININNASTNTNQSCAGGGLTYNNISIYGGGTGALTFTGSNTFATFTINAPKTVKFTDGTDTTVTSFVATGTAVNAITITGTSTAGYRLSDTTGTNQVYYCAIDYATCEGGATWLAYTTDGNTDGGHNSAPDSGLTGWLFTSAVRRIIFIQ